ncbi:MAG: hypothetical protein RI897_1413, partial [Verrucomicrobiota bacterium]
LLALLLPWPVVARSQVNPAAPQMPAAAAPTPQPAPPRVELRGVWLTANDMPVLRDRERMRDTVATLARLQFNTLYPVVWNGGLAYYPSRVTQERQLQDFSFRGLQGQDVLEASQRPGAAEEPKRLVMIDGAGHMFGEDSYGRIVDTVHGWLDEHFE